MWRFFPQFRGFFALVLGTSVLLNFSDSASILGLRLCCSLFCSICLFSAYLYPMVASLVGFSCGSSSLVVPVCVWGFFLWRRSCLFFLSSCWVWGRLLLSLFWCGFCAFSWGACGFPQCVLQLVTLSGFCTYLAPVLAGLLLRWSLVVGLEVSLMSRLVFYHVPCSSSGTCSLRSFPAAGSFGVFCLFCQRVSVLWLPW